MPERSKNATGEDAASISDGDECASKKTPVVCIRVAVRGRLNRGLLSGCIAVAPVALVFFECGCIGLLSSSVGVQCGLHCFFWGGVVLLFGRWCNGVVWLKAVPHEHAAAQRLDVIGCHSICFAEGIGHSHAPTFSGRYVFLLASIFWFDELDANAFRLAIVHV